MLVMMCSTLSTEVVEVRTFVTLSNEVSVTEVPAADLPTVMPTILSVEEVAE